MNKNIYVRGVLLFKRQWIRRVREKKNGEKEQEERKQEKLDLLN